MAGIDKTYIDGNEYPIYRQWWIDNYHKMVKDLKEPIYLYTFNIFDEDFEEITPEFLKNHTQDLDNCDGRYDFAIWNTSETVDKWLIKNCDIPSFRERMLEVYSRRWSGFKGQSWISKPKMKEKKFRFSGRR